VDRTNGRYGDVVTWTCTVCSRQWLHYAVEYEGFSRSGRWFKGIVPAGHGPIEAEGAVELLARLPWYLAGGSFFGGGVHRTQGAPAVDL